MADEVRLIDANALKEDFMNDYNNCMMESLRGNHHDVIRISDVIERIENAPTIKAEPDKADVFEAITREQYHDITERFFDEFVDNGANEETVAKCMFIGLAFGKLELMLFGENEDGDTCD